MCRKAFTDKKNIGITNHKVSCEEIPRKSVRLIKSPVISATHCLVYEKNLDLSSKHKPKAEYEKRTSEYSEAINKRCERRCDK